MWRKIGSQLIKQELSKARGLGKPLRLRVLRESRAIALYERRGLVMCAETDTHTWMESK